MWRADPNLHAGRGPELPRLRDGRSQTGASSLPDLARGPPCLRKVLSWGLGAGVGGTGARNPDGPGVPGLLLTGCMILVSYFSPLSLRFLVKNFR